jgi:hypothetical protein
VFRKSNEKIYLEVIDSQSFLHQYNSIVNATDAVQYVGKIEQRHVTILVRSKVQRSPGTLQPVEAVADYTPIQSSQVVKHPAWSNFLMQIKKTSCDEHQMYIEAINITIN